MEKKLIGWGVLSGALAGLLAFVFARIFAEPQIQAAIDYESGRDAAQEMLNHAGGMTEAHGADGELFSRAVQANLGAGLGIVGFGVAMGALFAVVFTVCLGRVGKLRPRTLALLVAGAGFLAIYLTPFVKYPANPPAIGSEETIGTRGGLYLIMVLGSVVFLGAAVWLGRRLAPRLGNWNASLVAGAAFVVATGILMAILPPPGHLAANVAEHGVQATETPQPLTDPAGHLVYPGFPADTLFEFRLYSVGAQVILWGVLGLMFGPLAQRVLHRGRSLAATG
ncbi:CbtA family protein [Amycolatopsis pithecellobii]|uniref:Cobalt transporter n=1 Tax=Amycolatopsis pithecellobii TaxID=664692 RepID=A0A6N7ZBL0_9PSEU|nr:CbtA family protein [Amycolatopsis pithecellobii]MTD59146.1 cobalt transporter [Amycolatopsis pithecellobii]